MIEIPTYIQDTWKRFTNKTKVVLNPDSTPEANILDPEVMPWLKKKFATAKAEIEGYNQLQLEALRRQLGAAIKKSTEQGNRIILSKLLEFIAETSFKKSQQEQFPPPPPYDH